MAGDAASAGRLLTESPLRELTAGVFADWEYGGPVSGELALRLFLGENPRPPRVALDLALEDVSIEINPLALPVGNISGQLRYATDTGFAGSRAGGRALGGRLSVAAAASQAEAITLALEGEVDAQAVARWLEMPLLAFARGTTAVDGEIRVDAVAGAGLALHSDLEGVALDLPAPFGKSAAQPLPLQLDVPLRSDPVLAIGLGERLRVDLALRGRQSRSAGGRCRRPGAGHGRAATSATASAVTLSTLDIAAWGDFLPALCRAGRGG
jgi:uncharacterized protein YhdP